MVKTDLIMKGYFRQPQLTEKAFDNGWFKTGDYGYINKAGYLYLTGRMKESIVLASGKKVSPTDVDDYYMNYVNDTLIASCGLKCEDEYDEILYELALRYRIIIAHPERYSYVQGDPNFCLRWLNEGYYLQANQNSLFKKETKKVLVSMIEHGFVSFVASDAHNEHRPCVLSEAKAFLEEEFGNTIAFQLIEENPRKILDNGKTFHYQIKKIQKKKRKLNLKIFYS